MIVSGLIICVPHLVRWKIWNMSVKSCIHWLLRTKECVFSMQFWIRFVCKVPFEIYHKIFRKTIRKAESVHITPTRRNRLQSNWRAWWTASIMGFRFHKMQTALCVMRNCTEMMKAVALISKFIFLSNLPKVTCMINTGVSRGAEE